MNLLGIHIFFGLCVAAISLLKEMANNLKFQNHNSKNLNRRDKYIKKSKTKVKIHSWPL
jgi:hypothetical protein